jgi:hypothetical protein
MHLAPQGPARDGLVDVILTSGRYVLWQWDGTPRSGTPRTTCLCVGCEPLCGDVARGKLQAPLTSATALAELEDLLQCVDALPMPDLRGVPRWVRAFFQPRTLKEALRFAQLLQRERHYFLLASLLGILHHQRPGFLSFPSSHLVPYLRSRKFPQAEYPHLYAYRPLAPRLRAKVTRALKHPPTQALVGFVEDICQSPVESVDLPQGIDCVITSARESSAGRVLCFCRR